MALAKIKKEHATTVVAFGNSGLPLGERDDVDQLAIIAQESQNPNLLNLFEVLPPLDQLKKTKVDKALVAAPVAGENKAEK